MREATVTSTTIALGIIRKFDFVPSEQLVKGRHLNTAALRFKKVMRLSMSEYELKNVGILRQNRLSILTPQISKLMSNGSTKHQNFAQKHIF